MTDHNVEIAEMRRKYEQEMIEERARVRELFKKRGIPEYVPGSGKDRVIKIEQVIGSMYEYTWFVIPDEIDLRKVIHWFVHCTKYGECTVFLKGCPPTTIYSDDGIEYFFRHLALGWF